MTHIIGHKRVCAYLTKALKEGFYTHAYLLTGQDGIGKRTAVLDVIGRYRRTTTEAPDPYTVILEPDDKGTITIDDHIKPLKKTLSLVPPPDTRLFVIIDRADRLTRTSTQAVLKMMEEPPAYATFFLVTSVPGMLPDTLRSRCMELRCNAPTLKDARSYLETTALGRDEQEELARLSGGRIGWLRGVIDGKRTKAVLSGTRELQAVLRKGTAERLVWAGTAAKAEDLQERVMLWLNSMHSSTDEHPRTIRALLDLSDALGRTDNVRLALEHFVLTA